MGTGTETGTQRQTKNSILIVDDEKSNLLFLNRILSADYTLYVARNGREAIERANEYLPDLILLDILMPGMDGYEVLAVLKKSPKTREIPVIFITGLDSADDEMKGLFYGADDYIAKPLREDIILLRVKNQIRIVNQMREIITKELAEKSSRVRSEFLSLMSHEMLTPMNVVIGMLGLIKNTGDPEKIKDYLFKIETASHDLLRLIEDVLDVSYIKEEEFILYCSELRFDYLLKNISDEVNVLFKEKEQKFSLEIDSKIPGLIICDEKRLTQVIMHLLSNAGKFTDRNGCISLKAEAVEINLDFVNIKIEVKDNGIGMSEEEQQKIFEEFRQADGGIKKRYGGAGLGLCISKRIAELMDGDIKVESKPGKGSVFTFEFKSKLPAAPPAPAEKTEKAAAASPEGKTALVADDFEINLEIMTAVLEEAGMNYACAFNGREAFDIFKADPGKFDIIFMDVNMPEMDGIEASRKIRSCGIPEGKTVPIVAVTANMGPGDVKNYLEAGMTDCIRKPVEFDEILRRIELYI